MTSHKLEQTLRHPPEWIAIDWGTSGFRAWAMKGQQILQTKTADAGLLRVRERFGSVASEQGFEQTLREQIGPWLDSAKPGTQILMCGMVGSRQGWREAAYVECPASLSALTQGLCDVNLAGFRAHIVPGICQGRSSSSTLSPDVMRGEETQLLGLAEHLGSDVKQRLFCIMPGTHSKHLVFANQKIESFRSYFSGELYQWLISQSLLAASVHQQAAFDHAIFQAAVRRGARVGQDCGALLHELFATRARGLLGKLDAKDTATWISGLVLGHELGEVPQSEHTIYLLGSDALCERYALALNTLHHNKVSRSPTDAALLGLQHIYNYLQRQ